MRNRKLKKKKQKNSKIEKVTLWLHFKLKLVEKGREREKLKIIITFRSNPTRNRKFQKNSNKIEKIKIYHYSFISSQNRLENAEKVKK